MKKVLKKRFFFVKKFFLQVLLCKVLCSKFFLEVLYQIKVV